ncbi:MAG: type II secretion system F family protein [Candidatus Micrarchaeota archaeon]
MFEKLFEEELHDLRINIKFNGLLFGVMAVSALAALAIFFLLQTDSPFVPLISLAILFLPPSLLYFFLDYFHDRKQKKIDEELPEVLFQVAAFPRNTPMEKIIGSVAEKNSVLGTEFRKAGNLIKAGFAINEALLEIAGKNDSILLKRSISLILDAYESGGEISFALNEIAQDISEMHSLQKQNAAAFSTQKYTLLAGVAVLIPLILGLLLGVVGSLHFNSGDSIFGMKDNSGLVSAIRVSVPAYLFLLSIAASTFVAMQEGKLKKAPAYFCMLLPCSLAIFHALQRFPLI